MLTGFPKGEGILQAVRCLSPELIICDEAGSRQEAAAIEEGLNAGVGLITTLHAGSLEEIYRRSQGIQLLQSGAFYRIVLLEGRSAPGTVQGIYEVGDPNDKNDGMSHDCADRGGGWISAPHIFETFFCQITKSGHIKNPFKILFAQTHYSGTTTALSG